MEPSDPHFHHPYQPYNIQLEFMQKLYQCIENGHVGIFESPTGTGKSLSLICGALTWLRNNERRNFTNLLPGDAEVEDWLAQAEVDNQRQQLLQERLDLEQKLREVRQKEARTRHVFDDQPSKKKRKEDISTEEEFVLDDYESDSASVATHGQDSVLSTATRALLEKLAPTSDTENGETTKNRTKVIFCSRTHSQLTQLVGELRKVNLPSGLPIGDEKKEVELLKHLSLGSRRNLCINSKVAKLSSTTAMNERCLDLQKPGAPKDSKCSFLPSQTAREDRNRIENFEQTVLADILDIEDIGKLGKRMKLCPYYASRSVIPAAEVVTLPYPLLLQKAAREALGIIIKDNVVIIDEAHNLIDAIAGTLSVNMPLAHLELAKKQLLGYCQRFKNRLKGRNRVYIAQVLRLLNSCISQIQKAASQNISQVSMSDKELIGQTAVDQIQPHKLLRYLNESKLVYKVEGYAELLDDRTGVRASGEPDSHPSAQPRGVLAAFQALLIALMNPASEGRFYVVQHDNEPIIKYTLLDPREHFREVVEEARAVILAGGTMSPMRDFSDRLFSYLDSDKIEMYSFGHVIPEENLSVQSVAWGPSGQEMDFRWESRRSTAMLLELGRTVEKVSQSTPDGTVIFFPSYDYLTYVVSVWQHSPKEKSIWETVQMSKRIFEEKRSSSVDELLREYTETISLGHGAIMLAVVGGKLSEGINFADKLGRVVICIGLPFPNIQSAEWKAKVDYTERVEYQRLKRQGKDESVCKSGSQNAGREFTDNTTMRAVNQSIGRAIRHRNDYAAILLIDKRFATSRIQTKLPGWIQSSCKHSAKSWEEVERNYLDFFRRRAH